jgi:phage gpG-like protein
MSVNVTVKSYRQERQNEIMNDLTSKMERVGQIVENQAKLNVSKSPPEHPQVQTGQLRSSIMHEVDKSGNEIIAVIGTNVVYGKYLELYERTKYPWLFPAVELKRSEIVETLKGNFGTELNVNLD